jgi:hypothetical protein
MDSVLYRTMLDIILKLFPQNPVGGLSVTNLMRCIDKACGIDFAIRMNARQDEGAQNEGGAGTYAVTLAFSHTHCARTPMTPSSKSPLAETVNFAPEVVDQIGRALGEALAQYWSRLPQELQHDVFEAAVSQGGEAIRHPLAIFLHGKHHRTIDSLHARSLSEPDSLGG